MKRISIKDSLNIILATSLLVSCSASNDTPDAIADGSHSVKLEMRVGVSAGVVTDSRELDTWDGAQQVNDMRIYVFRCPAEKRGTSEEAYTFGIVRDARAYSWLFASLGYIFLILPIFYRARSKIIHPAPTCG